MGIPTNVTAVVAGKVSGYKMISTSKYSFTFAEVLAFGALTQDNQPIHSIEGIVQAGLVLATLPKFGFLAPEIREILTTGAMTVGIESKFRHPIRVHKTLITTFTVDKITGPMLKLHFTITCDDNVCCEGIWKVLKTQNLDV